MHLSRLHCGCAAVHISQILAAPQSQHSRTTTLELFKHTEPKSRAFGSAPFQRMELLTSTLVRYSRSVTPIRFGLTAIRLRFGQTDIKVSQLVAKFIRHRICLQFRLTVETANFGLTSNMGRHGVTITFIWPTPWAFVSGSPRRKNRNISTRDQMFRRESVSLSERP